MRHLLFLSLVVLISLASCTMQKRHYRKGWYVDRGSAETSTVTQQFSEPARAAEKTETSPAEISFGEKEKARPLVQPVPQDTSKAKARRNRKTPRRPDEPMFSYARLKRDMAARGCRVHPSAKRVRSLSMLAWPLSFFIIGPLVGLLALKLMPKARARIERDNEGCKDDNLRIVDETENLNRRTFLAFSIIAGVILTIVVLFLIMG